MAKPRLDLRDPVDVLALAGGALLVVGLITTFGTRRNPEWKGALGSVGDPAIVSAPVSWLVILVGAALLGVRAWLVRRRRKTARER